MAQIESAMLPLGTPAPTFSLKDVTSDKNYTLSDFADKNGLLVIAIVAVSADDAVRHLVENQLPGIGCSIKWKQ